MKNPFPSSKKGQGISMETIVIAVIVVSVLVILLLVFTGRINWFGGQLKVCAASGGVCSDNPCNDYTNPTTNQKEIRQKLFDVTDSARQCGGASNMEVCCSGVGIPQDN